MVGMLPSAMLGVFWLPRPHTQGFPGSVLMGFGSLYACVLFISLEAEAKARLLGFFTNLGKWVLDDYEALNLRASLIGTDQPQSEPRLS